MNESTLKMRPASNLTEVMAAARRAFERWQRKTSAERVQIIPRLKQSIFDHLDELTDIVTQETGKVPVEAFMTDVWSTFGILDYYEKNAFDILKPKKTRTPFIFQKSFSYIEYKPFGVVLVITPWNNPFQLAVVPCVSALLAGNAVILKPSERTPRVGALIGKIFEEAGLHEEIQIVPGDGQVARALIDERPDKIFFTGGAGAGRKVMEAAARHLIPVILELGGKDPMIVFEDAQLKRAANAAVYGAFAHLGQHCISTKRLYVQKNVYDVFLQAIIDRTQLLKIGRDADDDLGVMPNDVQVKAIEEHIADAVAKGARMLTPPRREGPGFYPVILGDVDHRMQVMQEETFGPVLPVMAFDTEEEAISLANDTVYGLNCSVWSQDVGRARRVVGRLATGNAYINNVLINIGNPCLPFGGIKWSGMGKYHGPEGLYAFSIETSVMVSENRDEDEINWFPYAGMLEILKQLLSTFYPPAQKKNVGSLKTLIQMYRLRKRIKERKR